MIIPSFLTRTCRVWLSRMRSICSPRREVGGAAAAFYLLVVVVTLRKSYYEFTLSTFLAVHIHIHITTLDSTFHQTPCLLLYLDFLSCTCK